MKQGYTEIAFILDKSGSMSMVTDDTIGGYNQFIKEQRDEPGEAKFTLVLFDTTYTIVHNGEDIKTIPDLNERIYRPSGMTALYDSIGRTITEIGHRLDKMIDEDKPEKIIIVIMTDGAENSSKEINISAVNKMITHQKEKYKWEFVFLGANQDAFEAGRHLGISVGATMSYAHTKGGTTAAIGSMSKKMSDYRGMSRGPCGQSASFSFDDDDYKEQEKEGVTQNNK